MKVNYKIPVHKHNKVKLYLEVADFAPKTIIIIGLQEIICYGFWKTTVIYHGPTILHNKLNYIYNGKKVINVIWLSY